MCQSCCHQHRAIRAVGARPPSLAPTTSGNINGFNTGGTTFTALRSSFFSVGSSSSYPCSATNIRSNRSSRNVGSHNCWPKAPLLAPSSSGAGGSSRSSMSDAHACRDVYVLLTTLPAWQASQAR
ncbi:hypothetical protein CUR178_06901 [Leishmania enriettii]|uniref:Uncharacterized protein n=1 Tax=Leishmania enriettii TaxID=5663 RepID=A0A836KQK5_LEIEN|nr:hypothetical protein CUR178_06901 [Leishmania enriettii]